MATTTGTGVLVGALRLRAGVAVLVTATRAVLAGVTLAGGAVAAAEVEAAAAVALGGVAVFVVA